MIRIAICDSMEQDRKYVTDFCKDYFKDKIIEYEIREYASGESLMVEIFPDVLFLDTRIQHIDGILIKEVLSKLRAETKIIFISREHERMINAFGKNVYGFMEKPIQRNMFGEKLETIVNDILDEKSSVFCKQANEIKRILFRDIVCIKAYGRYTKIYVRGEDAYHVSDKCFGDWYLEMENRGFLCCHRSYLVNLCYIKRIQEEIELVNGMKVPIARDRRREVLELHKRHVRRSENGEDNREIYANVETKF